MKYKPFDKQKEKSFSVFENVLGFDLSGEKEKTAGSGFKVCENVWYKDGKIVSRPAINTSAQNRIFTNAVTGGGNYKYRLTDTEVEFEGNKGRIAELNMYYDESNCTVYTGVIFPDNNFVNLGYMHFGRIDDETYFLPDSILYYQGKAQGGGGIFAIVSLVNQENFSQKEYRVYEINSDFSSWQTCTDYYIPTVYINGRGDTYEFAEENGAVYTEKPRELEALNMLDGSFYAYFTTDGYSNSFRLPFSKLENSTVICRVYISMDEYIDWTVNEYETSNIADYNGQQIVFNIDREKGMFYFTKNNQGFAFGRMFAYDENNLRIFARKELGNSRERVLSCKVAEKFSDKIVFSDGVGKGEVYYSSYNRPLYFPLLTDNIVGSPSDAVTGLCAFEDKILVFKEKGIYTLKIVNATAINATTLLVDNLATFYNAGKTEIKTLNLNLGCISKTRAAKFLKGIIWQDTWGEVFAFYKNGIHNISSKISSFLRRIELDEKENAVSLIWGNYYILFLYDKAVVINIEDILDGEDKAKIFIWRLPEEYFISGAFSAGDKISLLLSLRGTEFCYAATFGGEKDKIINSDFDGSDFSNREIKFSIETKPFYPEKKGKNIIIKKAFLDMKAHTPCSINFITDCGESGFYIHEEYSLLDKDIKLYPLLKCDEFMKISVEGFGPFEISDSEIYYTF